VILPILAGWIAVAQNWWLQNWADILVLLAIIGGGVLVNFLLFFVVPWLRRRREGKPRTAIPVAPDFSSDNGDIRVQMRKLALDIERGLARYERQTEGVEPGRALGVRMMRRQLEQTISTWFNNSYRERVISAYERLADSGREDVKYRSLYYDPTNEADIRSLVKRLRELSGGDVEVDAQPDSVRKDEVRLHVEPYGSGSPRRIEAEEFGIHVPMQIESDNWETLIERVVLEIAGHEIEAALWKPKRLSYGSIQDAWTFPLPDELADGEYPSTTRTRANNKWWSSDSFITIRKRAITQSTQRTSDEEHQ